MGTPVELAGGALLPGVLLAKEENSSTGNVIPAVAPHIHVLTRHKRIHAQKSGDLLDQAPHLQNEVPASAGMA